MHGDPGAPVRLLVEHCTSERDDGVDNGVPPKLSLKGKKTSYTNKLEDLKRLFEDELPELPVLANTNHLFRLQEELRQKSLGRDYQPPSSIIGRRGPRLGSFEVFVELRVRDGLKSNQVATLVPLTSKLESKKFPDVRRVVQLVRTTVCENVRHMAESSVEGQQHTFTHHVLQLALQYTLASPLEQPVAVSAALGADRWADALHVETWETASARELEIIPRMLIKSKLYGLLRNVLCNLHFLAAKASKCGVKAVLGDLEAAQACLNPNTSVSCQISPSPGFERQHPPAASYQQQQLRTAVDSYHRFMSKNISVMCVGPASIYRHAQKISFPGLTPLKQKFTAIFQHLQVLAREADQSDRESTSIELLKFMYGVLMMKWAQSSGFESTFSETDRRWMTYCCQDFRARIVVRKDWIKQMLAQDAHAASTMFEIDPEDEVLGHFKPSRLFFILMRAMAIQDFDSTLRLVLESEHTISVDQAFQSVQTVLKEMFQEQGILSVKVDVLQDTQRIVQRDQNHFAYFVTIGLSAIDKTAARSKLESVISFLRGILDKNGPELAVMLPNRTRLRYTESEGSMYLVLKFCLPTRMPSRESDKQRYKEMLQDDLIASSRFDVDAKSIVVVDLSSSGALVLVSEDFLPPDTSTEDIAKDFIEQIETSTSELLSPDRLVSLHIFWISYMYSKPPQHMMLGTGLGLNSKAHLLTFAESSDLQAEKAILSELVFPALSMECKSQGIDLNCILFAQDGFHDGGRKAFIGNTDELVARKRLLRNLKSEQIGHTEYVKLGVVGSVQSVADAMDKRVLQDDDDNDWTWTATSSYASYSTAMLHLCSSLFTSDQDSKSGHVYAMIRRQTFGGKNDDGSFLKQVPTAVRAAFTPDVKTDKALLHLISRTKEVLGPEKASEYSVAFAHFRRDIVATTRESDILRVQQHGIEAFAFEAFRKVVKSFSSSSQATKCARAYPWQFAEVELQQKVRHRHESVFFAEKGGQLEVVLKEILSVSTSMDMTAPCLILLDGVSGSGRSALLANLSSVLTRGADRRYVVYFCKAQGCTFENAMAGVASQLWLQLVGGKYLHSERQKSKWTLADVFDVVQRASAQSCNGTSSTYSRVVMILDGFADDEQLDICEHLLARPRLFALMTCILSSQPLQNFAVNGNEKQRIIRQNRKRLVRSHLHSRVIAMPRLSDTEALQVATNLASETFLNADEMLRDYQKVLLQKREIWRPGYIRCLVQSMCTTSGSHREQTLLSLASSRSQIFSDILDDLNRVHGSTMIGELMCSLITVPGYLDSELRVRHCQPQGQLTDGEYLFIMQTLKPFVVLEDYWRDGAVILVEDCVPHVISKYVIPPLECLPHSTKDLIAYESAYLLRNRKASQDIWMDQTKGILNTELPENLGNKLSMYWAKMEEEAFLDDKRRYEKAQAAQYRARFAKPHAGSNTSRSNLSLNSSLQSPNSGLKYGRGTGRIDHRFSFQANVDVLKDDGAPIPIIMKATARNDQQIVQSMMEEIMATSEKAFRSNQGVDAGDNRLAARDRRARSTTPYHHDTTEEIRRPKSAGPKLSHYNPFTGNSVSDLVITPSSHARESGQGRTLQRRRPVSSLGIRSPSQTSSWREMFGKSTSSSAPFLELRSSPVKPQRLKNNWIDLDPHIFASPTYPAFNAEESGSLILATLPRKQSETYARQHTRMVADEYLVDNEDTSSSISQLAKELALALEIELVEEEILLEVRPVVERRANAICRLIDIALEDESEMNMIPGSHRLNSSSSQIRDRDGESFASSSLSSKRESNGNSEEKWKIEQTQRRRMQDIRSQQLAKAYQVREQQEAAWNHRHQQLIKENEAIRYQQELVHEREAKPFVMPKTGPFQGRWLYERLQVTQSVKDERKRMRQKMTGQAKQRQKDLEDYLQDVSYKRTASDARHESERMKDIERLVREAVQSPEAFDEYRRSRAYSSQE